MTRRVDTTNLALALHPAGSALPQRTGGQPATAPAGERTEQEQQQQQRTDAVVIDFARERARRMHPSAGRR